MHVLQGSRQLLLRLLADRLAYDEVLLFHLLVGRASDLLVDSVAAVRLHAPARQLLLLLHSLLAVEVALENLVAKIIANVLLVVVKADVVRSRQVIGRVLVVRLRDVGHLPGGRLARAWQRLQVQRFIHGSFSRLLLQKPLLLLLLPLAREFGNVFDEILLLDALPLRGEGLVPGFVELEQRDLV